MTNELKPVNCGCGGKAAVLVGYPNRKGQIYYRVKCWDCGTQTCHKRTREEAITAWNRAMGERTAKVGELEKRSETMIGWEGICTNCGAYTLHEMNFCFQCGCRLEWE